MKRQLSIKGLILSAIALCSFLSGNIAHASLMTYSFEGAVSNVTGVLFPTLNTGLKMTGNITFDSGAAPIAPGVGVYLNPITGLNLHIGSYNAAQAPGANGFILTNSAPGGIDNITTFASMSSGTAINGTLPTMFDVSLTDPSGNVLSGATLPTAPPSLNSFASNQWRLTFANGNFVLGSLTKLQAVPLPAAVILFGAGLISLVGLGAGGLRNLRGTQA
jgi:hypothetical protein